MLKIAPMSDLLSTIRNTSLVISVYLYFVGWLYAYYLFLEFGVSLHTVEIPVYYFFVYAYSVLLQARIGFRLVLVTILLIVIFVRVLPSKLAVGMICVALFPAMFYAAERAAREDATYKRQGNAKTIRFIIKPQAAKAYPAAFRQLNCEHKLRLLVLTKDRYFVFHQPPGEKEELPYATTYDISRSDVVLAEIDIQNTSVATPDGN